MFYVYRRIKITCTDVYICQMTRAIVFLAIDVRIEETFSRVRRTSPGCIQGTRASKALSAPKLPSKEEERVLVSGMSPRLMESYDGDLEGEEINKMSHENEV